MTSPQTRSVVIVGTNHELDPKMGAVLPMLDLESDAVIVGWDPREGASSEESRWPMLLEHVRAVVTQGVE